MAMGWTIVLRFPTDVTLFAPHRLHRLWGISFLLFEGYRRRVFSSWEKRPRRDPDHLPLSTAECNTFTPPYSFMACTRTTWPFILCW